MSQATLRYSPSWEEKRCGLISEVGSFVVWSGRNVRHLVSRVLDLRVWRLSPDRLSGPVCQT